jgi:type II secretory pathway pseudopilin PulG
VPGTPAAPRTAPGALRANPHLMPRLWHRIGQAVRDEGRENGFTVLEVVVSFMLFAFVAGAATTGVVSSLKASHESQQRVDAADVAQYYVDQARTDTTLPTKYPSRTYMTTVGNETFEVQRTLAFDGGATQCGTGVTYVVQVKVLQANSRQFLARSDARVSC